MKSALKFLLAGAVIGLAAWSLHLFLSPLVLLLFVLWTRCATRFQAFTLWSGYYLGMVNGLPLGATQFFAAPVTVALSLGILFWIVQAAILAVPWILLPPSPSCRFQNNALRLLVALMLSILPPFGLLGWGHPIAVAGVLFPGFAWVGLVLCGGMMLAAIQWHTRPGRMAAGLLLAVSAVANLTWHAPALPTDWIALDTHLPKVPDEPSQRFTRHTELQNLVSHLTPPPSVILLPENVAWKWSSIESQLWQSWQTDSAAADTAVFIGAHVPVDSHTYHNALVMLLPQEGEKQYHARLSMPVSNYNPFAQKSSTVFPLADGIVPVAGRRPAFFICYESVLTWPYLLSLWQHPDMMIVATNVWWAQHTTLPTAMRFFRTSWARLFTLPLLNAENG